jgi:undecaprenyl diphosphate synthase
VTTLLDLRNMPRHVAITMDGNGRWAELRGRPRMAGHRAGSHAVRRVVRAARRLGLQQLTLYAFSAQNWGRPHEEVEALMALLHEFLVSERDEILQHRIRLRAIGDTSRLPAPVREVMDNLTRESGDHGGMVLTLALSYGGREEIADAARAMAEQVARGTLRPEEITPERITAALPSLAFGDPDLMIRTGGEQRISNFLLWGSAYSELVFSEVLWPDFTADDLYAALLAYQRRQRRFGLVPGVSSSPSATVPIALPCPTSSSGS